MAAEVSELLESVKKMVRSILLTEKNGLTGHQLQGIYSEFVGGTIPFKKLGYPNLDAYLRSVPDAARPRGDGTYQGVANDETKHIQQMVGKQKSRKRKPRISSRDQGGGYQGRGKPRGRGRGSYRGTSRGGSRGTSRGRSGGQYPSYNQTRTSQPASGYRGSSRGRSLSDDRAPRIPESNNPRPLPSRSSSESHDPWQRTQPADTTSRRPLTKLENGSRDNQSQQRPRASDPGNNNDEGFRAPKPPRGRGYKKGRDVPPRFRRKTSAEERYSSEGSLENGEEDSEPSHEGDVFQRRLSGHDDEAMDRVSEILEESTSGVYMADIPKMYRERYNESVDLDLIDKMAALDLCHKEKILEDHFIVYKKLTITAPRDRFAHRQVVESGNTSSASTDTEKDEPRTARGYAPIMATSVTTLKAPTSLPELTLPEEDVFQVLVSLIYDTSHFYCYIVGEEYSDQLRDLEDRMKLFYSDEDQLVLAGDPLPGHYYAARSGNDWLRALVEDVNDGLALCRFADHGDKEEVEICNIRHLPRKFCALPEQSFVCCLDKLDYAEIPEVLVKRFVFLAMTSPGGSIYAQVVSRDDPLRVILYNETRCINDILLNILMLERPE